MQRHLLKQLMPNNAQDEDAARELVSLGADEVGPVVPEMLRLLKSIDSPVCAIFADFFAREGECFVDHVASQLSRSTMRRRRRIGMPLFMVIEHFRSGDAAPVYRRFKEHGRMAPDGLTYVSSWVDENLAICYQLMETSDRALLDEWTRNWSDLIEFEIRPVISSQEAAQRLAGLEACPPGWSGGYARSFSRLPP